MYLRVDMLWCKTQQKVFRIKVKSASCDFLSPVSIRCQSDLLVLSGSWCHGCVRSRRGGCFGRIGHTHYSSHRRRWCRLFKKKKLSSRYNQKSCWLWSLTTGELCQKPRECLVVFSRRKRKKVLSRLSDLVKCFSQTARCPTGASSRGMWLALGGRAGLPCRLNRGGAGPRRTTTRRLRRCSSPCDVKQQRRRYNETRNDNFLRHFLQLFCFGQFFISE